MDEAGQHRGSCLCGAVSFTVAGELSPPDLCHCTACRKQSGHAFASTDVRKDALRVTGGEEVQWFASSEHIRRGFCRRCGSSLFWEPLHRDWIAVAMGAFDHPTGTRLKMHIHVADKGDYYTLADGVPQHEH